MDNKFIIIYKKYKKSKRFIKSSKKLKVNIIKVKGFIKVYIYIYNF
jgi:hypothetical protein